MAKNKYLIIAAAIIAYLLTVECQKNERFRSGNHMGWGSSVSSTGSSLPTMEYPIVRIEDGNLRGFTMRTVTSRAIDAFQGIPFAQPPVGALRFRDPIRNAPWRVTRDAIAESPECIQTDLMRNLTVTGQEDCLYLNVYRPQGHIAAGAALPVLVWIHGGGNFFGSGSIWGPAYLLDRDLILVTFNYRIGPFGFLSTGDDASAGNQGLKDQVMALKWVQENIREFGGDPNSVTIFGESSGAGSVHHHIISPLGAGLFQRGISQSGSAFSYWAINENSTETAKAVGRFFNCPTSSHQMVDCLRNVDANEIAAVQRRLFQWNTFPMTHFGPVVEHQHPGAFLTETPKEMYRKNRVPPIPWIIGFCSEELEWVIAGLFRDQQAIDTLNSEWDWVGPILLDIQNNDLEENQRNIRAIRQFYMGNSNLTFETRHRFSQIASDRFIFEGGLQAMRYHSRYTGAPTYSSVLTYKGKYSIVQRDGIDPADWGVVHNDDLLYLLNNTLYFGTNQPKPSDDEEFQMSRMMTGIWYNFVSTGVPYVEQDGRIIDVWKPIPRSNSDFSPITLLDLNLNPKMMNDPYVERYSFWRKLNLSN